MYIDSRPVSLYRHTQGWKLPSPQPTGSIKRPPILKNGSTSSSLKGMEQTIPSFQSFIKQTPPLDHQKPLPPTPLRPRRASSFDASLSRTPSSHGRRTSSIYSRTVSQWDPDWEYERDDVPDVPALPDWSSIDFTDQHNLLLRPIAYSASTSQLEEKAQEPQLLEPRVYSPLIHTPSPTASRVTTPSPSPPPEPRPSVLLPPLPGVAHIPKKHLRTVSLEKAKELLGAPGAAHLLPEEWRAQKHSRSKSQEPIRIASMDVFGGRQPPELPAAPISYTLVDEHGRERVLSSPSLSVAPAFPYEYPSPPTSLHRRQESGASHLFYPEPFETGHARTGSREKVAQTLGLEQLEEDRGRKRSRGPRNLSYDHYLPNGRRPSANSDNFDNDAQNVAREYHTLLGEQYRQASPSPVSRNDDSETEVKSQMKMVPQPLFHSMPTARGTIDSFLAQNTDSSRSPHHRRADSDSVSTCSSTKQGSFPLRLSTTPPAMHSRRSTSGSIPISPPSASPISPPSAAWPKKMSVIAPRQPLPQHKKPVSKPRRNSDDNRVSMYYPHVMSRKAKKPRWSKGKEEQPESPVPGVPLLAADVVAKILKTPQTTPEASPLRSNPPKSNQGDHAHGHTDKHGLSLQQRVLKGAAKIAGQHKKQRSEQDALLERVATAESPHLLPSPSSGKAAPAIHLGWSDQAKASFDRVRPSVQSPRHQPEPIIAHVQTPPRPLDESRAGLTEPESPVRKGSIGLFGGLMESWRESKADKRREDLKKMIKVVAPGPGRSESVGNARPVAAMQRRLGSFNWS